MKVATSDGVAEDPVGVIEGDDTTVRRLFFKGQNVPDNWNIVEGSVEDDERPTVGLGAAPHAYKHQIGEDGQVAEEHAPAADEETAPTMRTSKARSGGRGRRPAASSE